MSATAVVHVAGHVDERGIQRCKRCPLVMSEPGLSRWPRGTDVRRTELPHGAVVWGLIGVNDTSGAKRCTT